GCSTPRHQILRPGTQKGPLGALRAFRAAFCGALTCEWVFSRAPPAVMPGGVLLFQRLSVSTIGAVWFHGRVRDGIGWVTDAMATKQWSRRSRFKSMHCRFVDERLAGRSSVNEQCRPISCRAVVDGADSSSANRTIRTG